MTYYHNHWKLLQYETKLQFCFKKKKKLTKVEGGIKDRIEDRTWAAENKVFLFQQNVSTVYNVK